MRGREGADGGATALNFTSIWDVFWVLLILYSLWPLFQQRQIFSQRVAMLRRIEQARGSRVIAMIHRQESVAILGIPIANYIDIEDSEQVLRAIRMTPPDLPIDIILHTPGGLVLAAEQIAHAIAAHPSRVAVFVPHYAMSGGTLLALAADEIHMDENAVLGPVDPQVGEYPAASIVAAVHAKPVERVDDQTLILADIAGKALAQMRHHVRQILEGRMPAEAADQLADALTEGRWTHDFPLTAADLEALGLKVATGLPDDFYRLMDLYPQAARRRPSVQYVPLPYQGPADPRRTGTPRR
jgi:ClpP class serine protease